MKKSPHHEYIRRIEALAAGPELHVGEGMIDRLGWEEPAPAAPGGFASLQPWRSPHPGLPRFLREKNDWHGIQAPSWVIDRLSDTQRASVRWLVVDGPGGAACFRLEGSYPALEALNLRVDVEIAEPLPRLWSLTLAMEGRPRAAATWIADCKLERVEAHYPAKIEWLTVTSPEDVKFVASEGAVGSPLALSRFEHATNVRIKQARTLKSLDVLRPMRHLRALSLSYLSSLESLDSLVDAEELALVSIDSCKDKNGAIRAAVAALRARGVLVRCEFTKSSGEDLAFHDF